jgi:hypothetical protein
VWYTIEDKVMKELEITLAMYDYEHYVEAFKETAHSVSDGLKLVSERYRKYAEENECSEEHTSFVVEICQPDVGRFSFEVKDYRDIQEAYLNAIKTFILGLVKE